MWTRLSELRRDSAWKRETQRDGAEPPPQPGTTKGGGASPHFRSIAPHRKRGVCRFRPQAGLRRRRNHSNTEALLSVSSSLCRTLRLDGRTGHVRRRRRERGSSAFRGYTGRKKRRRQVTAFLGSLAVCNAPSPRLGKNSAVCLLRNRAHQQDAPEALLSSGRIDGRERSIAVTISSCSIH